MQPEISVTPVGGDRYRVGIAGHTEHDVVAVAGVLARIARPGEDAVTTISRAFDFLLERESPESILRSFRLEIIGRYFPDFWEAMAKPR